MDKGVFHFLSEFHHMLLNLHLFICFFFCFFCWLSAFNSNLTIIKLQQAFIDSYACDTLTCRGTNISNFPGLVSMFSKVHTDTVKKKEVK